MNQHKTIDRRLVLRWIRATWFGWLLGIPVIIVLALVGEAVGIGGAQVLVGAGMGTAIGLMQSRVIRSMLPKSGAWIWSCMVGLGAPFLVTDIAKVAGRNVGYSLFVCVAAGGLISQMASTHPAQALPQAAMVGVGECVGMDTRRGNFGA